MNEPYIKIPTDMAIFSLKSRKTPQLRSYLAGTFIYPGKERLGQQPARVIGELLGLSERSIKRHFSWLLARNWMGKDSTNNWIFFRGIDRVHEIENWSHHRAAIMQQTDLEDFKAFLIGAVLSSIVKTGQAAGTDGQSRPSEPPRWPVSLSFIQRVLDVSRKTAFTYRKLAKKRGYINMYPNLQQIADLTPLDINRIKKQKLQHLTVNLFGQNHSIDIHPDQLRTDHGYVYAQLANYIIPGVHLKDRS